MCFNQHANHVFEVYRTRAIRKYAPYVKQTLIVLGFVFGVSHLEPPVHPGHDYALTVVNYGLTGHIMYIKLLNMHIDTNIHMYAHWFDSVPGYTSCACLALQLGPRLVPAGSD
jgi:hypothetical protein